MKEKMIVGLLNNIDKVKDNIVAAVRAGNTNEANQLIGRLDAYTELVVQLNDYVE